MSDWLIIRIPFDNPEKPEIIKVCANVPIGWKKELKKVAAKHKKHGRYLVANILYGKKFEYYYPESSEKKHKKLEKESGD